MGEGSDGQKKAPLVPPPPKLSIFGEVAESTPTGGESPGAPAPGGDPTPTSGPGASAADDAAAPADGAAHRDPASGGTTPGASEDAAADPPSPRRGSLPPPRPAAGLPKGFGVSGRDRGAPPRAPSASGLPPGVRPPGAPEQRKHEDTDVLIASAMAVLTAPSPSEVETETVTPTPALPAAETEALDRALAGPPVAGASPTETGPSRSRLIIAIAGVAAAGLLGWWLWPGPEAASTPETTRTPELSAMSKVPAPTRRAPRVAPPRPAAAAVASPTPTPSPDEAPPADADPAPADEEAGDIIIDDPGEEFGDAEAVAAEEAAVDDEAGEEVDAAAEPTAASGRSKRRKRHAKKSRSQTKPVAPAPKPPNPSEPDANALLRDAQKALRSGDARRAYAQAVKSRRAKRTSAALIVMAKAACRMGSESKAKSAFGQLKVGERRGIRAECRNKGIRLGL